MWQRRHKKQVCLQLIRAGHYNITDIAYVMGYNEPSAFRKAFKKWTGENPSAYKSRREQ